MLRKGGRGEDGLCCYTGADCRGFDRALSRHWGRVAVGLVYPPGYTNPTATPWQG